MTELFCELVATPSPSGSEQAVAKLIKQHLAQNQITADFDSAGNLIAKINGDPSLPKLLFVTHIDTVEDGLRPISPQVVDGVIKSDGQTILGADNKASVACLLTALSEIQQWSVKPTVIAVFSVREERGVMGVSELKLKESVDLAFCLDGDGKQGQFVYQAFGQIPFTVHIFGKEAHAAAAPEKGRHAIQAAALFISQLQLGKDEQGGTLNVGKISGGKTSNVIPGEVELEMEVRAYTEEHLQQKFTNLEQLLATVCKQAGCRYQLTKGKKVPPFHNNPNGQLVSRTKHAANKLGLKFMLTSGSFSGEANYLEAAGYPVLTVCRGGKQQHSTAESITVKELHTLKSLVLELVRV